MTLSNCPFCGGQAQFISDTVLCLNCGVKFEKVTEDQSEFVWNTRIHSENNERKRKHSFEQSPYFDFKKFRWSLPKWSLGKCRLYYDKALGYSGANNGKYINWIRAVKNWERDERQKAGGGVNTVRQTQQTEPKDEGPIASPEEVKKALSKIKIGGF